MREKGLRSRVLVFAILLLIGIGAAPLLKWRNAEEHRAICLSNVRRISLGMLIYQQDWDGHLPPPSRKESDGVWSNWEMLTRQYCGSIPVAECPENRLLSGSVDALNGCPVTSNYALNRRFWGVFSPGPFPFENLELPSQTALLVEAGNLRKDPFGAVRRDSPIPLATLEYDDVMALVNGQNAYPSPHSEKMVVCAADGHAISLKVEHYFRKDGIHDSLYGRIGDNIYNWNGGHPNGQLDTPPKD